MKSEQLYHELKELAEKLGVTVLEHNFRSTGTKAKSGLCTVKGEKLFIMDKNRSIHKKIEVLAGCLRQMRHENIFVYPALRDFLNKS